NEKHSAELPADLKNTLVKLDCAACHQLDGQDPARKDPAQTATLPRGAVTPARTAGTYMLPVNFEAHCKACHPLDDFNPRPDLTKMEVPHRVQPAQLLDFLRPLFTDQVLNEKLGPPDKKADGFNPFQRLDKLDADAAKEVGQKVRGLLESATKDLFL